MSSDLSIWAKSGIDEPDKHPEHIHIIKNNMGKLEVKKFHQNTILNYRFDDLNTNGNKNKSPSVEERKKMTFKLSFTFENDDHKSKIEENIPSKIDLRIYSPGVYTQGNLGSCVAQSICAGVRLRNTYINSTQYKLSKVIKGDLTPVYQPSRLALYWHARLEEGHSSNEDSGSSMHAGLLALEKYKLCEEKLWSYNIEYFSKQPPLEVYVESNKHKTVVYSKVLQDLVILKYTLSLHYPIVFGIVAYKSLWSHKVFMSGVVPLPKDNEESIGGHALLLVGYDDEKQVFIFQNSWGNIWGDHGYGYLPYEYVTSPYHSADFWAIEQFN